MRVAGKRGLLPAILTALVFFCAAVFWLSNPAAGQVLGSCGTPSEDKPAAEPEKGGESMTVSSMPLPGERAINFELPAVIGDEIKMVKLSDYNGSWRVVCFYPADFTFV